ncbi:hypothetical protein CDL12_06736 [Handroanthus impetiginosus]|uniref:Uncharacterized protein n=1 Tax=Handroanthus impetiginosus TaxID=429701 RepID=A0A2G9HSR5_9LAMI|nr:hypothetical protein CDL12_06736 [Handroanthus impetiginosus]
MKKKKKKQLPLPVVKAVKGCVRMKERQARFFNYQSEFAFGVVDWLRKRGEIIGKEGGATTRRNSRFSPLTLVLFL